MKNEKIISAFDKLDPNEETENEILNIIKQKQNAEIKNKTSGMKCIFYKPAAVIAIMVCLAIAVSAAAVMINLQYVPFKGFVENGDYEIYYTPEILKLGQYATAETVTRVKNGKTSELSIIITDTLDPDITIITEKHGEFNLQPAIDYNYSSFGTMGQFQFTNEGGYSSYGYFINDFPEINEFTLVSGGESTEVKLAPSNPGDVLTAYDSGVSVRFYSMSKGSKVLAYEVEDHNFDIILSLNDTMSSTASKTADLDHWASIKLYDADGNEISHNGAVRSSGPMWGQNIIFLRTQPEKKISRITVDSVIADINIRPFGIILEDNLIYSTAVYSCNIPVPADGEELIFDHDLLLYDANGLTSKLKSVTRKGNELTIYTDTAYNGNDFENYENIESIYMWFTGLLGVKMTGPGFQALTINGDEDSIQVFATNLRYHINGSWDITFE